MSIYRVRNLSKKKYCISDWIICYCYLIPEVGNLHIYYHRPHEMCISTGGTQKFCLYLTMSKSGF